MSSQGLSSRTTTDRDGTTRRAFLGNLAASAASTAVLGAAAHAFAAPSPPAAPAGRKIKLGFVGCGGRGAWLASLFQKNGGYEMYALADYFQSAVDKCGDALDVDKRRRFTGLSGYKKVLESGVEAVAILDIPYFYAGQVQAAVNAGCHVYMAKPVATDVPGCLAVEAAAKQATEKRLCFHVDYQMPTDPVNIEIAQRIWDGAIGKILSISTWGSGGGTGMGKDTPRGKTLENVMQDLKWLRDIALGGDQIGNFDIHSIDAAMWITRQVPIAASGQARICRPNPVGDHHDLHALIYECPNGMTWVHQSYGIPDVATGRGLYCDIRGELASAQINYWGKSYIRGGPKPMGASEVVNLYEAGAKRNIATFHQYVSEGQHDNPTVRRTIDGTLTTILGREAGHRGVRLTMAELLRESKHLTVDLSGLKE
ncbi:MAG: Gfo/Idh/MocA family protein [Thermoguttaceae bacterium]